MGPLDCTIAVSDYHQKVKIEDRVLLEEVWLQHRPIDDEFPYCKPGMMRFYSIKTSIKPHILQMIHVKNAQKPEYTECLGYLKDKAVSIHLRLVGVVQVNASFQNRHQFYAMLPDT